MPVFTYLLVVIYLSVLRTVYLLSVVSLGVWYSPLPILVYCFPIRLWSFVAIALTLSFVLSHLSHGGKLVESHSVACVAQRRIVAHFFYLLLLPGMLGDYWSVL